MEKLGATLEYSCYWNQRCNCAFFTIFDVKSTKYRNSYFRFLA